MGQFNQKIKIINELNNIIKVNRQIKRRTIVKMSKTNKVRIKNKLNNNYNPKRRMSRC